MRGHVVPLLLAVLLAGCAMQPAAPATVGTPATPDEEPDASTPMPRVLLSEAFDAAPARYAWSHGIWDPHAALGGSHEAVEGGVRLRASGNGTPAYGLMRTLHADPRADEMTLEVEVLAEQLDRYGAYFTGPAGWVGVEFDREGFCACANGGSTVEWFAAPGATGQPYRLSIAVDAAGVATASAHDAAGMLLGSQTIETPLRAHDVGAVWVAVWSTADEGVADYTTTSLRVSQTA